MEITGKIVHIFNEQTISDKFSKRAFVVEYAENPEYPETVQLEFQQDKCSLLDSYDVGQSVTVGFNLRGRAWTGSDGVTKYFNTLQAWRISSEEGASTDDDWPD